MARRRRSPVTKEQLHAAARAYPTQWALGTPMDIMERFYIAATVLSVLLIAAMALL